MHISKNNIPVKIDAPGAVVRQLPDFGAASGAIGAEHLKLAAGTDLAPLLEGLENDACDSTHWGYIISGELVVSYLDGGTETCTTGELFHWPTGHSVRVERDSELIMFSPQVEHTLVLDHILAKMATV